MDPEEEFMMWILPQIMAEEEQGKEQPSNPPLTQTPQEKGGTEVVILITLVGILLFCMLIAFSSK